MKKKKVKKESLKIKILPSQFFINVRCIQVPKDFKFEDKKLDNKE